MGIQSSAQIIPIDHPITIRFESDCNKTVNINEIEYVVSCKPTTKSERRNARKFAIGVIDVQYDFCKGGSLAVDDADITIGPINLLRFFYRDMHTFVSQDYHPHNHMSFASTYRENNFSKKKLSLNIQGETIEVTQKLWPDHCVQYTNGVNLHEDLIRMPSDKIIRKGTMELVESYSVFGDEFNNKYEKTELDNWLKENNITDIVLTGIATDYCVYYTALDAIRLGYKVHLILSATRGVEKKTTDDALADMRQKGVYIYNEVADFIHFMNILGVK